MGERLKNHHEINSTQESIKTVELEQHLRSRLGMMLIKPDAIEAGIAEELIDHTIGNLETIVPGIKVVGATILPRVTENSVEQIYPVLEKKYKDAIKHVLNNGQSIVVFFGEETGAYDIWDGLKQIRGKVGQGEGLQDSIRAIIPLPGGKTRYEDLRNKLARDQLDANDYIDLTQNLVHVPENIREFAGLFMAIDEKEMQTILGEEKSKKIREELANYID